MNAGEWIKKPVDKRKAWEWMKANSQDMVEFVAEFKAVFPDMTLEAFECD